MVYDEREKDMLRKSGLNEDEIAADEKRQRSMSENIRPLPEVSDEKLEQFKKHQEHLHEIATKTAPDSYKDRDKQYYYERTPEYQDDQKFKADQAAWKKKDDMRRKLEENKRLIEESDERARQRNASTLKILASDPAYAKEYEEFKRNIEKKKQKVPMMDNERGMLGDGKPTFLPSLKKFADKIGYEGWTRPAVKTTGKVSGEEGYKSSNHLYRESEKKQGKKPMMNNERGVMGLPFGGGGAGIDFDKYDTSYVKPPNRKERRADRREKREKIEKEKFRGYNIPGQTTEANVKPTLSFDMFEERVKKDINRPGEREKLDAEASATLNTKSKYDKAWEDFLRDKKAENRAYNKVSLHDENKEDMDGKLISHAELKKEFEQNFMYGNKNKVVEEMLYPIRSKIGNFINKTEEFAFEFDPTRYVLDKMEDNEVKEMVKYGADAVDVTKLLELREREREARLAGDKGHANKLKIQMRKVEGKINNTVYATKFNRLQKEREGRLTDAKLRHQEAATLKLYKSMAPKQTSQQNKFGTVKKTNTSSLYPAANSVNMTSPVYVPRGNVDFGMRVGGLPDFRNRVNMDIFNSRQRIAEKDARAMNEAAMVREQARRRDAQLQNTFMRMSDLTNTIKGTGALPQKASLKNMPASKPKVRGVDIASRFAGIAIAPPRIGMASVAIAPLNKSKNNGGVIIPKKNKNVGSVNRISAGIASVVSPHKTMAQNHKDKFYHSPECSILNICDNVRATATSHKNHVAEFKNINIGVGKPAIKKTAGKKPSASVGVKMPVVDFSNIVKNVVGKKKTKKGRK